MATKDELTPKEAAFVDEWLIDKNGARAARAAGYSVRTAASMAHELLRKPRIKAAVKRALVAQQKRTLLTADQVLLDIDRIAAKAEGAGDFHAALRGKELVGKHYKLFTEKHEHGGIGGGPVLFQITEREAEL
jgi:hypothetical protein